MMNVNFSGLVNMRPVLFYALLSILCVACNNTPEHWRPLLSKTAFAEDFENRNGNASYTFERNTLTGTSIFNSPNTFFCTKANYSDFELKFQVLQTPGLNSGVQIRSQSIPEYLEGRVHGYQVEIEDSARGWAAGIYEEARRGWLNPLTFNPRGRTAFQKGKWNDYHIIAKGDTIRTWVNGIPCAHLVDDLTAEGFIGFQVHSIGDSTQANQTIQWRNVMIKTEAVGEGAAELPQIPATTILPALNTTIDEFKLQDDFEILQLAGEPQVEAPVAAEMDAQGNMWVVELPGYMRDIDGSEEEFPDGKIVVLSDIDGDLVFDRRVIYKDGLVTPRAICLAYNGLLYNDGRALYFDDLKTGTTTLVDSFYVQGNNIEHQPNGLYFNIDNWIYSAKSNQRYRLEAGKWRKENTALRGQWGMSADLHGRLVYNDNSNGLIGDQVMPNTVVNNPHLPIRKALFQQLCTDNKVYPLQATAMNRGYQEGVLDAQGKLKTYSSACSPLIYKSKGKLAQCAFVCAPEINAIKRYELVNKKNPFAQDYRQQYTGKEFLISTKETFRPVNIYNHPKGGMMVVDLRKGMIQHRAYMTHYLRELILEKGLDQVQGKGRIYWVREKNLLTDAEDKVDGKFDFSFWNKNISTKDLIQLLGADTGEMRLAAQKELIARDDPATKDLLTSFFTGTNAWGKIHGLWTLEGLGQLEAEDFSKVSSAIDEQIFYHILTLFDRHPQLIQPKLIQHIAALNHRQLNLQLSHLLPEVPLYQEVLIELINRYQNNTIFAEAFVSHLSPKFLSENSHVNSTVYELNNKVAKNRKENLQFSPALVSNQYNDNRNEGFPAYYKFCGSCHGSDGRGQPNIAPPVLHSQYLSGPSDKIAALILQGMEGPMNVNGEAYSFNAAMPGLKHNEELDDATITALIAFMNNAFSKDGQSIKVEKVAAIRARLSDREAPLTEAEVLGWK